MEEQTTLRELQNSLRIVGTLKEINLKDDKTKKGEPAIFGNIVVLTEVDGKVSEHRVELFGKKSGKLAKGYRTIMDTYKTIDTHGKENATRVMVEGNIDGNDYVNSEGKLISGNRNRGVFVREAKPEMQDEAVAQVELVVTGTRPVLDPDNAETGEYYIDGFTVGYNSSITQLHRVIVGTDLAGVILENYAEGSTGKLTFQVNNYPEAVVVENPEPVSNDGGFGVQVDMSGTFERRVRELRVIGGFPPYLDGREFTPEQIELANKTRALHLQEVQNSVPDTPPVQTGMGGFGANADPFAMPAGGPIEINDDDLPF